MSSSIPNEIANQSITSPVYRGDGVRLYGIDAEVERKLQAKRDIEYEKELGKWIAEVIEENLPFPDDLIESLRSGIVLCKLLNKISPGTIKAINLRPIPLFEMENIGNYLKSCWKIGVPTSDLFGASDLYQRKAVHLVVTNLTSLARACQKIEGLPKFKLGVSSPQEKPSVKKWEVTFHEPKSIGQIESELKFDPELEKKLKEAEDSLRKTQLLLEQELEDKKRLQRQLKEMEIKLNDAQEQSKYSLRPSNIKNTTNPPNPNPNSSSQIKTNNNNSNNIKEREKELEKEKEKLKQEFERQIEAEKEAKILLEKQLSEEKEKNEKNNLFLNQKNEEFNQKTFSLQKELNENLVQKDFFLKQIEDQKKQLAELKLNSTGNSTGNSVTNQDKRSHSNTLNPGLSEKNLKKGFSTRNLFQKIKGNNNNNNKEIDLVNVNLNLELEKLKEENQILNQQNQSLTLEIQKLKASNQELILSNNSNNNNNNNNNSNKKEIFDKNTLFAQKVISQILNSEEVDPEAVKFISDKLLITDEGRRNFTKILKKILKQVSSLILCRESFDYILFLINRCLKEMHKNSNSGVDLFAARIIMIFSTIFCTKSDSNNLLNNSNSNDIVVVVENSNSKTKSLRDSKRISLNISRENSNNGASKSSIFGLSGISANSESNSSPPTKRILAPKLEFVREKILNFDVWKDLKFWEEFFFDELSLKSRDIAHEVNFISPKTKSSTLRNFETLTLVDSYKADNNNNNKEGNKENSIVLEKKKEELKILEEQEDKKLLERINYITMRTLRFFIFDMLVWRVEKEKIEEFVKNVCQINSIDSSYTQGILETLSFFDSSFKDPSKRKELESLIESERKEETKVRNSKNISTSIVSNDNLEMQGFLSKRGNKGLKSWKKRFFKVNMKLLLIEYYLEEIDEENVNNFVSPKGTIDLSQISIVRVSDQGSGYFQIDLFSGRTYFLFAETKELATKWIDNLNLCKKRASLGAVVFNCKHDFESNYFTTPQYCQHCSKFIYGVFSRQGVKCTKCEFSMHFHCAKREKIPYRK